MKSLLSENLKDPMKIATAEYKWSLGWVRFRLVAFRIDPRFRCGVEDLNHPRITLILGIGIS